MDFRTNLKNVESNKFTLKAVSHFEISKLDEKVRKSAHSVLKSHAIIFEILLGYD